MNQSKPKTAILVNLDANGGRAENKWNAISNLIIDRVSGETTTITYHVPFDMSECIHDLLIKKGFNHIISAGGDGSANIVLNCILQTIGDQASDVVLGFIGLGSSNDVLKPFHDQILSIPVNINSDLSMPVDLGLAVYLDKNNKNRTRYFIANSSLGVGAFGNSIFNSKDMVIRLLKSRLTHLSMTYAAIKSILFHKNYPVHIRWSDQEHYILLSYLTVLKKNHVSGDLKFDQEILPDDGMFGLNICENMNQLNLLRVMLDLKEGRFSGKTKRHSSLTKQVTIKPNQLVPVEFDGEIEWLREINYTVCPRCIQFMQ